MPCPLLTTLQVERREELQSFREPRPESSLSQGCHSLFGTLQFLASPFQAPLHFPMPAGKLLAVCLVQPQPHRELAPMLTPGAACPMAAAGMSKLSTAHTWVSAKVYSEVWTCHVKFKLCFHFNDNTSLNLIQKHSACSRWPLDNGVLPYNFRALALVMLIVLVLSECQMTPQSTF